MSIKHLPTSLSIIKVACGLTLLRFCLLTILLIIIPCSKFHAQIEYSLYANPLVLRYGNMDRISTEYTSPNISVHYANLPSQHFGFEMTFPSSKKVSFMFGIQHVSNHYKIDYNFYAPNTNKQISAVHGIEKLNTQSLGFKVGIKSQLSSRIAVQASFGFLVTYKPKDEDLTSLSATTYSYSVDSNGNPTTGGYNFIYKYHISKGGLYPQLFIPDLSVHFRLVKNLYLRFGTQLKFIDFDKSSGYFDVLISGKANFSDGTGPDEKIHFSRIKRTEFNYYLGLSYSIMGKGRASKRRLE
ncbi:MAG: hypothetical protein ACO1N0_16895 [Fluviicola sp.]